MTGAFKCLLRNHLSAHTSSLRLTRGISSAGRAPALQAGGQRFDPAMLHQIQLLQRQKMDGSGTKLVRNRQDHVVIAVEFGFNRSPVCWFYGQALNHSFE